MVRCRLFVVALFRTQDYDLMMPELFHHLPKKVIQVFSGRNLLYHLLAIAINEAKRGQMRPLRKNSLSGSVLVNVGGSSQVLELQI